MLDDNILQCILINKAIETLDTKGASCDAHSLTCDCNQIIEMPAPKTHHKTKDTLILDNELASGEIYFIHNYLHSATSIEQPRHGACVILDVGKWTYNKILLSMKNKAFRRFKLPTMPVLDNTRTRMIVALFIESFMTSGREHDAFKEILNATHRRIDATYLDEDCISSHYASRFYEWSKISMAKHATGDNLTLLNILGDTCQVTCQK